MPTTAPRLKPAPDVPRRIRAVANTADWKTATAVLGGKAVLGRSVDNPLEAHDLLQAGLPAAALHCLVDGLDAVDTSLFVDKALGMSVRTLQRSRAAPRGKLSAEQGNRVWRAAEIIAAAMRVFGDPAEVQRWLTRPALGLNDQQPLDLMSTAAGSEVVANFLQRLEYGVYT